MSKIDEAIASAQKYPAGAAIEVPISLWSPEEIEELYKKLPADLRIDPEGRMPGCVCILRVDESERRAMVKRVLHERRLSGIADDHVDPVGDARIERRIRLRDDEERSRK